MAVTSMQAAGKINKSLVQFAGEIEGLFQQGNCPKPFDTIVSGLKAKFIFGRTLRETESRDLENFKEALQKAHEILYNK